MSTPIGLFKKKFFTFFFIFFTTIFYLSSCSHSPSSSKISKEEKIWMTDFFQNLLLVDAGVYTLLGSKPITRINLENFTEEEKQAYYAGLSQEELDKALILKNYCLSQNWENWKRVSNRFPLKRYMLFDKLDEEGTHVIYFVNIFQAAVVIQENYEAFHKVVQYEFNPLDAVLEIQNKDSKFWNAIQDNFLLWGLLLGYGKVNSYAFFWKHQSPSSAVTHFMNSLTENPRNDELIGEVEFTPSNFDIPSFISFESNKKTINHYRKEKENIKKIYAKQDFVEFTLDVLTN